MDTIRSYPLNRLPQKMRNILREGQREAAKVWNLCKGLHHAARSSQTRWPNRDALQKATKGQFALHSQSVQMVVHAFLGAVDSTKERKPANPKIRYPYKEKRFYPLLWPARAMAVSEKRIILPMGRGRKSVVLSRPEGFPDDGGAAKIVWNGVGYELHVAVHTPEASACQEGHRATADLGQIHQAAVTTDDGRALIVSGRAIRSEKRRHNKTMGKLQKLKVRCKKGSKRYRRLTAAGRKDTLRIQRRVRDLRHKGTRQVIDFCRAHEVSTLYVGNPDGVRAQRRGRKQKQRMLRWEYGKDIDYLSHKSRLAGMTCFTGTERGTSSRCPSCGQKHKPKGRVWRCKACGFVGHRDLVGSFNMHEIAFGEKVPFPERCSTTYLRPGHKNPWQAAAHEDPAVGSSRCPDAGHSPATERIV